MRALDFIAVAAFVMALVAFPFSVYTLYRQPIRSALVFAIPLLVLLIASDTSQEIAQSKVLDEFDALGEKYQISINGTPTSNTNDVLLALKTLRWLPAHHSSPTKRINVEISDDSRRIVLSLARDSNNPREYWVFYPKHIITKHSKIGRIVTPVFDNY
jgi:hypothetical protein